VERTRHQLDVAGALLVLLAAGALIFGLLQGGVAWAWRSPPSLALFAVAAAATVAAAVVEIRAAGPIVPPWFWRRPALAGSGLAAITAGIHDVYLALALAAVGTLVAVLVLVPRRFALPGAKASAGPAGQAGPAAPMPSTGDKSG
jgi:hypothetical protein